MHVFRRPPWGAYHTAQYPLRYNTVFCPTKRVRLNQRSDGPVILDGIWLLSGKAQALLAGLDPVCFDNEQRNDLFLASAIQKAGLKIKKVVVADFKSVGDHYESFAGSVVPEPIYGGKTEYLAWKKADFVAWCKSKKWKLAQTMRWCPHDYVIAQSHNLTILEMFPAVDFIWRNMEIDVWRKRPNVAYFDHGDKYWTHSTGCVNHTTEELKRRIFLEDGKDEFGRKIKNS